MNSASQHRLLASAGEPCRPDGTPVPFAWHGITVQPCVIGNRPHIIYPRGLRTRAPRLYRHLCRHFHKRGFRLREDRRRHDTPVRPDAERRRWVPAVMFTLGLLFESTGFAETGDAGHGMPTHAHQQQELHLASGRADPDHAGIIAMSVPSPQLSRPDSIDHAIAARILETLKQHYVRQSTDPDHVLDDMRALAAYYSGFPEVVSLLDSLGGKKWRLRYRDHKWATVASGNAFGVDSATIYFNTRAAAQLKMVNRCQANPVCIASPADALLHELLHAHSMLVNTREFLAQGGMGTVLYPYRHEYAVIAAERKLYASMTRRDRRQRPQRYDHTGRVVNARCPTCIS